jgi:hypothetical protein
MTLDQALVILEQYRINAGIDELTAIERLVRCVKTLTPEQLEALDVFMVSAREPA